MKTRFLLFLLIFIAACSTKNSKEKNDNAKRKFLLEKNTVGVFILKQKDFSNELITNGKLATTTKSELYFLVPEQLLEVKVKNGSKVNKGNVLARLKQTELKQKLQASSTNLQKTKLDLQDILIGQGFDIQDTLSISKDVFNVAKLRSGYTKAFEEFRKAKLDMAGSVLKAPFTGTIANIKHKVFEQINTSEAFCTLLDESIFEVNFSILETELNQVAINKTVRIVPFYNKEKKYFGEISQINPVIDAEGLIKIKADINGEDGLLDGMNVKVFIEDIIPNQYVVPREAVVLRQNKEVLFRVKNGKAYWTYVTITNENSTLYTVIADIEKGATLNTGDSIIISGNLNLAHDSEIVIE